MSTATVVLLPEPAVATRNGVNAVQDLQREVAGDLFVNSSVHLIQLLADTAWSTSIG